jgi:hypothetical protein
MQWRAGTVVEQVRQWPGAVECTVAVDGDAAAPVRALAYTAMVGAPSPGERVLLNASALLRGLGTGGLAFVVARPDDLPPDPPAGPGHIVKARYTPMQQMLLAVDEQDSEHHAALADADDLAGMPVVVADLHSALPAVVAGIRTAHPGARVAYVMTDGGALPAAFSRAVAGLTDAGWLAATLTVGQAFGGDHEAVTTHTGLLAARHVVGADVTVVAQGPGNVGTGTRWGYSGVACADALHAADVLGGRGVASLRVSGADRRERHRGISHHSRTAYGRALLTPADVPVTALADPELDALVRTQLEALVAAARATLTVVEVPADGLLEALRTAPVILTTMGRGLDEDPAPFVAAAAAGAHAGALSARP